MHGKKNWIILSVMSLMVVALLGVIMRYKIAFEFPFLNQKNLQHAHSHFAFTGWVSQTLYLLIFIITKRYIPKLNDKKYVYLLGCNFILATGMLISFTVGGYTTLSILFSTAALLVSYVFTYFYIKDTRSWKHPSAKWFKTGLWFAVLSSLGTLALAYMMATKNIHQKEYLSSVYFYLHFQYNGWFFFACMGLFMQQIAAHFEHQINFDTWIYRLFVFSCVPAYFLSTLWLKLPVWLYILVVIAAIVQLIGWFLVLRLLKQIRPVLRSSLPRLAQLIFALVGICITVKLFLQLGSTIPEISHLAFGYRHIVIAYLHLILLAIVSVYLITYLYFYELSLTGLWAKSGLWLFIIGVYINEVVLGIQGIASFSYTLVPFANEVLLGIAVLIVLSLAILLVAIKRQSNSLPV